MAKSNSKSKKTRSSEATLTVQTTGTPIDSTNTLTTAPAEVATDMAGLEDLLLDSIKDIYWAENHLVKALPKMVKAAASSELKQAFTDHLELTRRHVVRLEQVFELLGKKKQAKKCDAMEGIVMEGEGVIDDTNSGTLSRDVALIHSARKVENYEMTNYKGIIELAGALGKQDVIAILSETLNEEQQSDDLLASISAASLGNLQSAPIETV